MSARENAPMAEVHAEALQSLAAKRISTFTMTMSSIFLELEKVVDVSVEPAGEPSDHYSVATRDLNKIEAALDLVHCPTTGNRLLPTDIYFQTALTARRFMPRPAIAELPRYHDLSIQEECRRIVDSEDRVHSLPNTVAEQHGADVVGHEAQVFDQDADMMGFEHNTIDQGHDAAVEMVASDAEQSAPVERTNKRTRTVDTIGQEHDNAMEMVASDAEQPAAFGRGGKRARIADADEDTAYAGESTSAAANLHGQCPLS